MIIQVGKHRFENYPLTAYESLELLADMTPYIGKVYESISLTEAPSVDAVVRMVTGLGIPAEQLKSFVTRTLARTTFEKKPIDLEGFDWSRKIHVILELCYHVLREEYTDFLADLVPTAGTAKEEVETPSVPTESDN